MVSKHEHMLGPSEGFGITHIAASTPKVSNPEDTAWDGRICISKFPSDSDASGKGLPLGTTGQKKETGKGAKKVNGRAVLPFFLAPLLSAGKGALQGMNLK